jgi:hypothetical protein
MNQTHILAQLYMNSPIYFKNGDGHNGDLNLEINDGKTELSMVDENYIAYISSSQLIKNDKKMLNVSEIDTFNKIQIKYIIQEYSCLPFIVPKYHFVAEITENENHDINSTLKLTTYSICKAGVYSKSFLECDTFYSNF